MTSSLFLTSEPNNVVRAIHPKVMPAILTKPEETDLWMNAPIGEALKLQRPRADETRQGGLGRPGGLMTYPYPTDVDGSSRDSEQQRVVGNDAISSQRSSTPRSSKAPTEAIVFSDWAGQVSLGAVRT